MDVWARASREGVGNDEPWIKARVTSVLVIKMSSKSLGGCRARYSRGWQKDVSGEGVGNGEPWIKARVTPVLVIEMSRKSLGGWRATYSRG